jgi:hypothetical protein
MSPAIAAGDFEQGAVFSLTEENDFFNSTDRWYTQGAKLAFLQADNDVPKWTRCLFDHVTELGFSTGAERIGYQFGQSIFTPADTHSSEQLLDDRPYAGWLYTGFIVQRRGLGLGDHLTLENFQMDIGIIGPESAGDQMQTWYHHRAPRGWEYQLKDEPGLALKYGRACLIPLPTEERRYLDVIPHGGLSAGNVDTSFRAGTTVRAGYNLPDNFGVQPIDSLFTKEGGWSPSQQGRRWGVYVFTGVEGRAQLYSAFLDGNVFRESQHIDKEIFVGEWRSGLVVVLNHVEIAYTHIYRTREFEGQPEGQVYGSISVAVRF